MTELTRRMLTLGGLFHGPLNSVLSLLGLGLLAAIAPPLFRWAVLDATWIGSSAADCTSDGACWVFVHTYLPQFIYGFYPEDARWRINLAFFLLVVLIAGLLWQRVPGKRIMAVLLACVYPFIAWWLFYGGFWGLPLVETSKWGGLFLTLVISGVGIAGSFPMGILLALGRRSDMPVIRSICTVFIELWRGVPLITVLFMASVMLPLFLPAGVNFDKLLRALIGVMLFAGAYMAEVVRGGMQGLPDGQFEAARAIGLSYWQRMRLVILPQALRHMIPGITNTFLALFKDTTLVLIIGLFDLLGIVQAAATDPEWLGYIVEGYVFAAAVFWVFCYGMSRYSRHLEQRFAFGRREAA